MIEIKSEIQKESQKKEEMFILYLTFRGKTVKESTPLRNFHKLDKGKVHMLLRTMIWDLIEQAFAGMT